MRRLRNKVVFEDESADLLPALDLAKFRVTWWFKHHRHGCSEDITLILLDINQRCVENAVSKPKAARNWMPPAKGALFFNVDGSALGNPGRAGIGGVLRDHRGRRLCSFSGFVGFRDSFSAEILSIRRACQLVSSNFSLHKRSVTILSDSKYAVDWINDDHFGSLEHVDWLNDIRNFLLSLNGLRIAFSSRDSNSFADELTKLGVFASGECVDWVAI